MCRRIQQGGYGWNRFGLGNKSGHANLQKPWDGRGEGSWIMVTEGLEGSFVFE
jgi:hypothetical protein